MHLNATIVWIFYSPKPDELVDKSQEGKIISFSNDMLAPCAQGVTVHTTQMTGIVPEAGKSAIPICRAD